MRETVDKRNAVVASDRLYRAVRSVIQEAHGVVSRVANWAMVDESNLRNMRLFYLAFPIRDALRHELNWTHYRSLMRIPDPIAREWYMNECIASSWGTRDLDRQIATQTYERRLSDANPGRRRKRKELPLTILHPPANWARVEWVRSGWRKIGD